MRAVLTFYIGTKIKIFKNINGFLKENEKKGNKK